MKLTTIVDIPKYELQFNFKQQFLLIGSCFSENISNKLMRYGFKVNSNPFGILYNPISIADCLSFVLDNRKIEETDLVYHDELWHSIYHHGHFSSPDKEKCLENCNLRITECRKFLENANLLLITFGSAYVHIFNDLQKIVGNCHKIPARNFSKYLLDSSEIVNIYENLISRLYSFNPNLYILFTISPVRHLRDGFHENQLSKSVLHLSIEKICKQPQCFYFPSYEIMMDELRDYRYYDRDMLHPNALSIDYIWERFSKTIFDAKTIHVIDEVEEYLKLKEHRPLYSESKALKVHQEKIKKLGMSILQAYPELSVEISTDCI